MSSTFKEDLILVIVPIVVQLACDLIEHKITQSSAKDKPQVEKTDFQKYVESKRISR